MKTLAIAVTGNNGSAAEADAALTLLAHAVELVRYHSPEMPITITALGQTVTVRLVP